MRILLKSDTITPDLKRLLANAQRPKALWQAGAKSVQAEISAHLRRLQAKGNAKGWPSQKFFAGGRDSVNTHVGVSALTDTGAVVTIADPRFVHHVEGGTVTPKRKKYLAIPLTAEAYAASGRGSIIESLPNLKVVKFPRGLFLVREVGTKTKRGATGGRKYNQVQSLRLIPLFKLVKRVTHRKHPDALPNPADLQDKAYQDMELAAKRLFGPKK